MFAYSIDSGATWTTLTPVNDDLGPNGFSNDADQIGMPIPMAADKQGAQLKFVFDGDFYFWMIDDVKIIEEKEVSIGIADAAHINHNDFLNVEISDSPIRNGYLELQIQAGFSSNHCNFEVFYRP